MRKMLRAFAIILTVVFGFLPTGAVSAAAVDNFSFESFEADYYIAKDKDGSAKMHVTETLVAIFPEYNQNHGIVRAIPYSSAGGANINAASPGDLNLRVTRNGQPENIYEVETENGTYRFKIRDRSDAVYVHGRQTYVLDYDFKNVVLDYTAGGAVTWTPEEASFQEIYWDTNGTGWSQPFGKLTARVHFEDGTFEAVTREKVACYVGKYGTGGANATSRCLVSRTGDGYEFSATGRLAAGENLTFAIGMKAGTFNAVVTENYTLIVHTIIFGVIFGAILVLFVLARRANGEKREFYKGSPVPPQYDPPKYSSITEMTMLYAPFRKMANPKVAILMGLAVRHKIELEKGEKRFGSYQWKIHVKSMAGVSHEEKVVLQLLNGGEVPADGEVIEVKRQKASGTLALVEVAAEGYAKNAVRQKGLFEKKAKNSVSMKTAGAIMILAFGGTLNLIPLLGELDFGGKIVGVPWLGITSGVLVVMSIVMVGLMGADDSKYFERTKKGLEAVVYLDGLHLYMKMAEAERMKFLQSVEGADTSATGMVKLYEKLLPYAILFGLEKSWMAELRKYYEVAETEPDWYIGSTPFIIADLNSFSSSTSSSISSGSMSSSSSGSSGGGFSGGGGGGGGGGGC